MPTIHVISRAGKWQLKWRQHGRQRAHTVATKRVAYRLKAQGEEALALHGSWEPPSAGQRTDSGSLTDLTNSYLIASSMYLAPKTLKLYAMHLDLFHRWLDAKRVADTPDVLSSGLLRDFFAALRLGGVPGSDGAPGAKRSEATASKYVQTVQNAWRWAWDSDEVESVPPARSIRLPRSQPRRTVAPTWDEMGAVVLSATGARQRLAWVLYCTGLRVDQAMRLLWDDLDLDGARLTIRPELGKTAAERRGRVVPLAPVLVDELAGWGTREGHLIPDIATGARPREARGREMRRLWKAAGVRAEVWEQRPQHSFRKGFRSGLKRLGADAEAIEFVIGHSQGLVDVYTDPDALPLREAVSLVPHPAGGAVTLLRKGRA